MLRDRKFHRFMQFVFLPVSGKNVGHVVTCLLVLNSALNPMVYALLKRDIKREISLLIFHLSQSSRSLGKPYLKPTIISWIVSESNSRRKRAARKPRAAKSYIPRHWAAQSAQSAPDSSAPRSDQLTTFVNIQSGSQFMVINDGQTSYRSKAKNARRATCLSYGPYSRFPYIWRQRLHLNERHKSDSIRANLFTCPFVVRYFIVFSILTIFLEFFDHCFVWISVF